jgi:hypothetical protein
VLMVVLAHKPDLGVVAHKGDAITMAIDLAFLLLLRRYQPYKGRQRQLINSVKVVRKARVEQLLIRLIKSLCSSDCSSATAFGGRRKLYVSASVAQSQLKRSRC